MKKKLFCLALCTMLSYANSTNNNTSISDFNKLKDFVLIEDKVSLINNNLKSTGYNYLESELSKIKDLASYDIKEIYNKNISSDWKIAFFDIDMVYFNGNKENIKRKIFYNKSIIVNDIFNENADSIGKKINLPLLSDMVYNKEYLVIERDTSKQSPNGEKMVIFTNSQCPFCKQYVPAMYEYALNNNMSLYVINLSNNKFGNSNTLTNNIITFFKYDTKTTTEKIKLIKDIYLYNFSTNENLLNDEFSKLVKMDINILNDKAKKEYANSLTEINNKLAKKIHITETPTVFIDNELFNDYGGK